MLKIFNRKNKLNKTNDVQDKIFINKAIKNKSQLSKINFFAPITKQWNDTIYTYEKNNMKLLPSFNKYMHKLIKGYFFLYDPILEKTKRRMSRRMRIRIRRLSTNRIFACKSYLKWTNTQVDINYNIFNSARTYLLAKLYKDEIKGTDLNTLKHINDEISKNKKEYNAINKKVKLELIKNDTKHIKNITSLKNSLDIRNQIITNLTALQISKKKIINNVKNHYDLKIKLLKKEIIKSYIIYVDILKRNYSYNKIMLNMICLVSNIFSSVYTNNLLEREKIYYKSKSLLMFNKSKFDNSQLSKLNELLTETLEMKTKINLTNLKHVHLNGKFLVESLAIKLAKRRFSSFFLLKKAMSGIKSPYINKTDRIEFPYKKHRYNLFFRLNKFNLLLSNVFKINKDKDSINELLRNNYNEVFNSNLENIKNKNTYGVRIQSSGRLTRRLIASRAVSKSRSIGRLKDRNSSVEGLTCKLTRGNFSSNIQYTKLNSKTRNGSFGLKIFMSND